MTSVAHGSIEGLTWPDDLIPVVELGRGGMAVVTLALRQGAFGFVTPVAVKRLLPQFVSDSSFVDMFLDEARLLSRLDHPNVVAVRDLTRMGDEPLLVLEYLEGLTASQLIKGLLAEADLLPIELAAQIAVDGLRGLDHAHALRADDGSDERVVHRDVSPQNLFVGIDGRAKLIDFGVSRAEHRLSHTRTGTLKGKFAYMAPEQLGTDYDHRIDIFAMGVVLFELLTSTRLFRGRDEREILGAVMRGEIPKVSELRQDCPPRLVEVVRVALEREPSARFATADAMAEAIVDALEPDRDVASRLGTTVWKVCSEGARLRQERIASVRSRATVHRAALEDIDPRAPTEIRIPSAADSNHSTSQPSRSLVRAIPVRARWKGLLAAAVVMTSAALLTWAFAGPEAVSSLAEPTRSEIDVPVIPADTPTLAPNSPAPPSPPLGPRRVMMTFRTDRTDLVVRTRDATCAAPCILHLEASKRVESLEVQAGDGRTHRVDLSVGDDLVVDLDAILPTDSAVRSPSVRASRSAMRPRPRAEQEPLERFPTFE